MGRRLFLSLFAISVVFFSACGKDDEGPGPAKSTPTPKPVEVKVTTTPTPDRATATPSPTPSEMSLSDIQDILTRRYKDLGYAIMTADKKSALDFSTDPCIDEDGKSRSRAQQGKDFDEGLAYRRELEKLAGETMRFSLQNNIIKVTRAGPGKVSALVRFTDRSRTIDGRWVETYVGENVDVWRLEPDGKWRICESKAGKKVSFTRTVNGKTEEIKER